MKRILLVGGGSGGHVFPLVAIADMLREKSQQGGTDLELKLWGDGKFLDKVGQEAGLNYTRIVAGKLRRYFSLLNILDFFKLILGFIQSLWLMFWYMPDIVFTKGGYASVMPAIAAKLYMIPVIVHESDSVPGLANKIIAKIAIKVLVSFESSQKYFKQSKTIVVGNPVRKEILNGDRNTGTSFYKLDSNKKTILVLGGSQGAKRINDLILDSLVLLVKDYQIIHQCGDTQYDHVKAEAEKYMKEGEASYGPQIAQNYRLYPFLDRDDMKSAYAVADVIVSRGGAGSIAEIALLGKPAIIIPLSLKASRGEQITNAIEFSKYGASVLEEANTTPHILINQIQSLLRQENYQAVSARIKSFARSEAAVSIAEIILQL